MRVSCSDLPYRACSKASKKRSRMKSRQRYNSQILHGSSTKSRMQFHLFCECEASMEEYRPIVLGLVGGLIAVGLFAWPRKDQKPSSKSRIAHYGVRSKIAAAVIFFIALFISFAAYHASEDDRVVAWGLSSCLLALSAAKFLEVMVTKLHALNSGLKIRSVWRRTKIVPWGAFHSYQYYEREGIHYFTTNGFGGLKISDRLVGLEKILSFAKRHRGPVENSN